MTPATCEITSINGLRNGFPWGYNPTYRGYPPGNKYIIVTENQWFEDEFPCAMLIFKGVYKGH